ncbi:hypothetical protein SARC_11256 [Sphaeroforma arctica JP610]|uniref:Nucleosome assembly protein n=1 Tax=Sphaeroforma arctica JP610 TaxID=667725 RepID=A0A0L0FHI4_9EUKA|nr:hypothetical protein SARC_11256 [Sphaeroforma arctica JP610]KNC76234.1 hypothetical protein SARC_11256 [Sphaeroforma arctica JP610]|eukprot:XP_014150136.1 hypothetical protein SARC_11256 [Sphaeroforma arctica JP610]
MQSPGHPSHPPTQSAKKKMRHAEPNGVDENGEVAIGGSADVEVDVGDEHENVTQSNDQTEVSDELENISHEHAAHPSVDTTENGVVAQDVGDNGEFEEIIEEEADEEPSSAMSRISELQANLVAREAQAEAEIHAVEVRCYNDNLLFYKERAELVPGVPGFWGRAFTAHMEAEGTLCAEDKEIMKYIEYLHIEEEVLEQAWFTVVIKLEQNPYIENHELKKRYARDETVTTGYSVSTTDVRWLDGREEYEYEDEETDYAQAEPQDKGQKRPNYRARSFFDWFDVDVCDSDGWGVDPVVELLTAVWRNPIQHIYEPADHGTEEAIEVDLGGDDVIGMDEGHMHEERDEHAVGTSEVDVEADISEEDVAVPGDDEDVYESAIPDTADIVDAGDGEGGGEGEGLPEYEEEAHNEEKQPNEEKEHDPEDDYEGDDDDVAMDNSGGEEGVEHGYEAEEHVEPDYEAEDTMAVDDEGGIPEHDDIAEAYGEGEGEIDGIEEDYGEGNGDVEDYVGDAVEGDGDVEDYVGGVDGDAVIEGFAGGVEEVIVNEAEDGGVLDQLEPSEMQEPELGTREAPEVSDDQPQTHAEISV